MQWLLQTHQWPPDPTLDLSLDLPTWEYEGLRSNKVGAGLFYLRAISTSETLFLWRVMNIFSLNHELCVSHVSVIGTDTTRL